MQLQPGDVIIVVRPGGQVMCWEQDNPDMIEYLYAVESRSTCDCPHDRCPIDEMPMWREQLATGQLELPL